MVHKIILKRKRTSFSTSGIQVSEEEWKTKLEGLQNWRKCRIDKVGKKFQHYNPIEFFDLQSLKGLKVLDIGCGRFGYKNEVPDCVYLGIDPLFNDETRHVLKGRGENLEIVKDEKVDTVFLFSTLQHSMNPKKILSECHRVLKVKGKIYSTTCLSEESNEITTIAFPNLESVEKLFQSVSFKVVENFEYNGVAYLIGEKA